MGFIYQQHLNPGGRRNFENESVKRLEGKGTSIIVHICFHLFPHPTFFAYKHLNGQSLLFDHREEGTCKWFSIETVLILKTKDLYIWWFCLNQVLLLLRSLELVVVVGWFWHLVYLIKQNTAKSFFHVLPFPAST